MSASIIQRSADPFTDASLARLYLDPILNKGSMYLFDFSNPLSNPNPDGALAGGATFKNLVDGGADGVYTPATGGNSATISVANAAGKTGLVSSGQTGAIALPPLVTLGAPGAAIGTDEFLAILWMKTTGNPFQGVPVLLDGTPASPGAGLIQYAYTLYAAPGTGGPTIQAGTRIGGGALQGPALPGAPGAVRQIALSMVGGTTRVYSNGALVGSLAGTANPIAATGVSPRLDLSVPSTMYRAYAERLTLSGRTALAAVQADYALNNGRFA
jgi:hypothetical protein